MSDQRVTFEVVGVALEVRAYGFIGAVVYEAYGDVIKVVIVRFAIPLISWIIDTAGKPVRPVSGDWIRSGLAWDRALRRGFSFFASYLL